MISVIAQDDACRMEQVRTVKNSNKRERAEKGRKKQKKTEQMAYTSIIIDMQNNRYEGCPIYTLNGMEDE